MGWIKRVLYGALIGIAAIAPGLSGGTIAITLGFYENLIRAVGDLLKHFKNNFLYLLPFGAGAIVSTATLSVVINFFFTRYPLPTNILFIGFILGTLPFIMGKLRSNLGGMGLEPAHLPAEGKKNLRTSHILTVLAFFLLVLTPVFLKPADLLDPGTRSTALSGGLSSALILAGVGIIVAATLVIPGLSGTMILSAIGYYKTLLQIASTFVTSLVSLDFTAASRQLVFILPLGVGALIGIFLTARLISFLFKKIPVYVYSGILGLILATPVVMLADIKTSDFSLGSIAASLVTLAAGLLLVRKLGDTD